MSSILRKVILVSTIVPVLLFCSAEKSFAGQWKVLRPDKGSGTRKVLKINGNEWSYYRLDPGDEMSYSLDQHEGQLRIITRVKLNKKTKKEAVYTFRLSSEGMKNRLYSRATSKTNAVKIKGSRKKTGKKRIIHLGESKPGTELSLSIDDTAKHSIFFRTQIQKEEFAETVDYVTYSPIKFKNRHGINTNDHVSTYYEVDKENMLSVSVIGPAVLKVNARLIMDESKRGMQKHGVKVIEDAQMKNTYPLFFRASQVSTIIDLPDKIPSRADKFFVEVPKGSHIYRFAPVDQSGTLLLRFFLPETALKNSE